VTSRSPTIAVLGGGQLGRMLGLAGIAQGLSFRFLDPSPEAPAAAVGTLVTGALDSVAALDEVARGSDVVTYEWEGVPADSARHLA
jgi:5-(carboxyamino)imidazole ribonucleotide synthase